MRRRTIAGAAAPNPSAPDKADKIDSLQRGLEVLRCFRPGDDLLEVAEVARRLDLPRPTALRLLDTLAAHGFLLRFRSGQAYGLHVSSFVVGQAVLNGSALVRHARPLLLGLADRFAANAMVCVGERDDMLVLAHRMGADAAPWAVAPGARLPVAACAVGRAWLWAQPAAVQSQWMARLRELGPRGAADMWKAFHDIEATGTCASSTPERRQATLIAAPVVLHDGATAVLGCEILAAEESARRTQSELTAALLGACEKLRDQVRGISS
jgi:DNA-binding IclR family transcriptional regulator